MSARSRPGTLRYARGRAGISTADLAKRTSTLAHALASYPVESDELRYRLERAEAGERPPERFNTVEVVWLAAVLRIDPDALAPANLPPGVEGVPR